MNSAFTSRVSSVRGGVEFLLALGFEEQAAATNPIRTFDSGAIARDTQVRRHSLLPLIMTQFSFPVCKAKRCGFGDRGPYPQ